MTKLSRKQRQSTPQEKPDYTDLFDLVPENDTYWKARLARYPLIRYRTEALPDDVIDLIKAIDSSSSRVFFDSEIIPDGQGGMRHRFSIEYRVPGTWDLEGKLIKPSRKQDQIDGAILSGLKYTTIEIRSITPEKPQKLVRVVIWFFLFFCPISIASLFLALFMEDAEVIILFGLTIFMHIFTLWGVLMLNQGVNFPLVLHMEAMLKTLEAVKIEEDLPKRKRDKASKVKK